MARRVLMCCLALVIGIAFAIPAMAVTVDNPMTADLDGDGYDIFDVADIIAEGPEVDVRAYSTFADAIDAIGTDTKVLIIPDVQNVTDNKTVPSRITLRFLQGGFLNISSGKVVTINGHLEAGLYQIFKGSGTVSFGYGAVQNEVYPEWWRINNNPDDQVQIQAAHDALDANYPGTIKLKAGIYVVSSYVTISKPVHIIGEAATYIRVATGCATVDVFRLTSGATGSLFRNFTIDSTPTKTAGQAFYVGTDSSVTRLRFENLNILNQYVGIYFNDAQQWSIKNCNFGNDPDRTNAMQLYIKHTGDADNGDNCISDCSFGASDTSSNLIYHVSGGGLRITNCKFLGGASGYFCNFDGDGTSSGALNISNNSFEGASSFEIYLGTTSDGFGSITICGNEIAGSASNLVRISDKGISAVAITGNVIVSGGDGTGNGISIAGVTGCLISGNTFVNFADGTAIAVANSANVTGLSVGINKYYDCATHLDDAGHKAICELVGNVGLGQDTFGTSADKVFAIGSGTAPTTSPANAFQQYSADAGGVAGQAGPHFRTEGGGVLGLRSDTGTTLQYVYHNDSLADDGTVTLPDATNGMVEVSCNGEAGMWLVQNDGTCTKIVGSTNTAAADTDTKLCVYDGGTAAVVKNRLGTTGKVRISYLY